MGIHMKNGKKKAFIRNGIGILCLFLLCLIVQGMLWTGRDTADVWNQEQGGNAPDQEKEEGETEKKVAYLTFDDGPSCLTSEYLAVLKEEKVPATFFLIGEQIEGELIAVVKQAKEDGHEIGVHTYCHDAGVIYESEESYIEDILKTKERIKEQCQIETSLFRFPWGSKNSYVEGFKDGVIEEMKKRGMEYVDWNVSGEDSVGCPSAESILANVRKDYKKYNNPVILLHDSASCRATLQALPWLLRELKQAGYSFATLSERKETCHFGEY